MHVYIYIYIYIGSFFYELTSRNFMTDFDIAAFLQMIKIVLQFLNLNFEFIILTRDFHTLSVLLLLLIFVTFFKKIHWYLLC